MNHITDEEKDRLAKFYDSLSVAQKMKLNEEFEQILRDEINKEIVKEAFKKAQDK